MTRNSKQYLLALMISNIGSKRAYLKALEFEFREAKCAGQHAEAKDIANMIDRIKTSLKEAEAAMEDLIGVETNDRKGEE